MSDSIMPIEDSASEKKENKRWSISKNIGDLHISKTVEEIENGFLCTLSIYGTKEGSKDYIDKNEKYFSKENPLKDMDMEIDKKSKENDKLSLEKLFNPNDINNLIK